MNKPKIVYKIGAGFLRVPDIAPEAPDIVGSTSFSYELEYSVIVLVNMKPR